LKLIKNISGGVEWLLFIFDCLSTPFVKICWLLQSYSVPEKILEEAEEATLQLLPAKSREHYEKVFSEFNKLQ
jgi:hypothetical protein